MVDVARAHPPYLVRLRLRHELEDGAVAAVGGAVEGAVVIGEGCRGVTTVGASSECVQDSLLAGFWIDLDYFSISAARRNGFVDASANQCHS